MPENSLRSRVYALCGRERTNLKHVCQKNNMPYKSCRISINNDTLQDKYFVQLSTYFNVNINWIKKGDVKDIDSLFVPYSYINREFISFDKRLKSAFDIVDTIGEENLREAIVTIIEYYRALEIDRDKHKEMYSEFEAILTRALSKKDN